MSSMAFEEKRSTDVGGVTPVRFNILGQMQIPGKSAQINSAFLHHASLHFPLGLSLKHNDHLHNHLLHSDSPLDFSKKKPKLDTRVKVKHEIKVDNDDEPEEIEVTKGDSDDDDDDREDIDTPASQLRNILSMKSPSADVYLNAPNGRDEGNALNLSKESPNSSWSSRASSPLSPSMENSDSQSQHSQSFLPSPKAAIVAVNPTTPNSGVPFPSPVAVAGVPNGAAGYPMSFSPWGNGVFSSSLSPALNQSSTTVPQQLSQMVMDSSTASFPYTSPLSGVNANVQLPNGPNGASTTGKGRPTRPFKAYPKDPMSFPTVGMYTLPMGATGGGPEPILHQQSHQAYAEFRKQMLASSQVGRSRRSNSGNRNGGHSDSSTDGLSFSNGISMDTNVDSDHNGKNRLGKTEQQLKDEAYWERRRKNNEAAKRSRDARRAKEDEIAIRAAFLEQENFKLRLEVCTLKNEAAKLRCMLYNTT